MSSTSRAGQLIVQIDPGDQVTLVGVLDRWDADGNARKPVNPKAKLGEPEVTATAQASGQGRWVFHELPAGRYDLVVLAQNRVRVEGFHYPPVLEFDSFLPARAKAPEDAREWIVKDIAASRHYENKVTPLYLGGDEKQVRVLVQLLRDKPTSFDAKFGARVATLRHEVWQYTNRYGGWAKEKRTRVLDRLLMPAEQLRKWTWIWEPQLGGIEVGEKPVTISYPLPKRFDPRTTRGLLPY